MSDRTTYPFQRSRAPQEERLAALEWLLDDGTTALLEARGVGPGWHCLEAGAGGGSIARWLCERVGPTGSVTAVDLDPSPLHALTYDNLRVERLDVSRDELPRDAFDLVHMRLLLAWLPDAPAALARLVAALRPGGWLVAEEMDFVSVAPDPRADADARAAFDRVVAAHAAVLAAQNAFNAAYGRRLVGDLEEANLVDVAEAGRSMMWRGARPGGIVLRLTLEQLRDAMVQSGRVTADDVDRTVALLDDPGFSLLSPTVMAAWGRRRAT
jgi:SAM-dependent methyltransferase